MDSHSLAKFTNNSIKPSLIAGTKKWSTLHDQQDQESVETEFLSDDEIDQPEPRNFRPLSALERDNNLHTMAVSRETSTADFYKRIEELKREHQTTLCLLNQLYEQKGENYKCHTDTNGRKQSHYRDQNIKVPEYLASTNHSGLLYDLTPKPHPIPGFPKSRVKFADSEKYDSEKNYDSAEMVSNTDSAEIISRMWDDFSVDDYKDKDNLRPRPKSAPVKTWKPVITIPEPFNMTLREEKKKGKAHTRSSVEVSEREQLRRESETRELLQRSRPRDPPAHIYLPLYEEIAERREQRSRFNRENSMATLMAVQQPFNFAERDEHKLKARKEKLKEKEKLELKKIKKLAKFRAQPVPPSVHNPAVADRIIEDKLYRNIKVKMRSEDLMRSSALPPRMHSHELMALERRKHWQDEVERNTRLNFRPSTRPMPDFKALHKREQLATLRKVDRETTVAQPFNLSSNRSSARVRESESCSQEEEKRKSFKAPPHSDAVPTRMTDSARLRIENMRTSLQQAEKALKEVREEQNERKERRRQLALRVKERSGGNDTSVARELEREDKLRRYKKDLRTREANYSKFLREVDQRVGERPLLFEQHNEKMAKSQAEKRYKDILESSGLSDDFLRASIGSNKSHDLKSTNRSYDSDTFEEGALSPQMHSTKRTKTNSSSSDSDVIEEYSEVVDDRSNDESTKVKELVMTS